MKLGKKNAMETGTFMAYACSCNCWCACTCLLYTSTGVRRVFTRIFGNQEVLAYVTATEKEHGKKRLFSVRFFQKNCRFSVHGRKKHH